MPAVFPFKAVQYQGGRGDLSSLIAPPYDVLGAAQKAALLGKNSSNIVGIDLPHTPAKELGPPAAYERAGDSYRSMLQSGVLTRRAEPALFAYRQGFEFLGRRFERCGMACCVEAVAFGPRQGGGILPHEETFSGPKEDRLALMRATRAQLSPIFGIIPDDAGRATRLVRSIMDTRPPCAVADMGDGVTHEVWTVEDPAAIRAYQDALAGQDVFIADGHHRYNTALNYLRHLEQTGPIPADHPARRTMMVMVGMSDPGLAIGPTHRVLGGMRGYSIDAFIDAARGMLDVTAVAEPLHDLERSMAAHSSQTARNVLGLYDFATGRRFVCTPSQDDPLAAAFSAKPRAWRLLDVAIVQHLVVERICQPLLNGGEPVKWAFPHSVDEVAQIGRGDETGSGGGTGFAQLAVIVRPTPLDAVRDISRANELMPQKSTFFYPKLATGLFINGLE